ncbi:MAG: hypothetical protein FD157_4029 [Rhodocyclaceae bacterium]|nr:MAG: hypothetical protein FD157_4029 [Rhodocyclaceae bacterium]TNC98512.1 MAG: hypothetical protein FD118_4016 [Rhodocyclaceae bacterium]
MTHNVRDIRGGLAGADAGGVAVTPGLNAGLVGTERDELIKRHGYKTMDCHE